MAPDGEDRAVNKDDMILISVDDHTVEPPDMFKNHLPKKYADDAPRLVHNDDGSDMLAVPRHRHPQRRAQCGGGSSQRGVRNRATGPR